MARRSVPAKKEYLCSREEEEMTGLLLEIKQNSLFGKKPEGGSRLTRLSPSNADSYSKRQ
jgi:hypothetical protein